MRDMTRTSETIRGTRHHRCRRWRRRHDGAGPGARKWEPCPGATPVSPKTGTNIPVPALLQGSRVASRASTIACARLRTPSLRNRLDTWLRAVFRSEEHTSELQSLMRISYAVFFLKKKNRT